MSAWRCKLDEVEIGPMPFQELVALLREGKISERALVRREGSDKWEPAWNVVGLMEAARREAAVEPDSGRDRRNPLFADSCSPPTPPTISPTTAAGAGILTNSATRGALAGFAALVVTGLVYRWVYWKTMAFPPPRRGGAVTYWFPLFGECGAVEYALLYADLFVLVAAVAWWLCGPLASRAR